MNPATTTKRSPITLSRFLAAYRRDELAQATADEVRALLDPICAAAKRLAQVLRRTGLSDLSGGTGAINVQGEAVKQLDQHGNDVLVEAFRGHPLVCTVVSEEMKQPVHFDAHCGAGRYAVLIDPMDGSSNLDLNLNVGTIFAFHRYEAADHGAEGLLRPGRDQVLAGYVLYGPSTVLVFTARSGVHAFTLDPDSDAFVLVSENIRMPRRGSVYAVNEGNAHKWPPRIRRYLDSLKQPDRSAGRPYALRYTGALAADFHRCLLTGGIYLYPAEIERPEGKLRLMYECAPLALVAEQAGGRASTGAAPISTIVPVALHQRAPLVIGSADDVAEVERLVAGG
jgi:fructose-1,6-bisphosphatase I